jgi:hypothetical protein
MDSAEVGLERFVASVDGGRSAHISLLADTQAIREMRDLPDGMDIARGTAVLQGVSFMLEQEPPGAGALI